MLLGRWGGASEQGVASTGLCGVQKVQQSSSLRRSQYGGVSREEFLRELPLLSFHVLSSRQNPWQELSCLIIHRYCSQKMGLFSACPLFSIKFSEPPKCPKKEGQEQIPQESSDLPWGKKAWKFLYSGIYSMLFTKLKSVHLLITHLGTDPVAGCDPSRFNVKGKLRWRIRGERS